MFRAASSIACRAVSSQGTPANAHLGIVSRSVRTSACVGQEAKADDLKKRPVRLENPGKVRMGFVPEEWFEFFYKKTGVTGPYVFGAGLATYLFSKEIYVMDHEFYIGLGSKIMAVYLIIKFGKSVAEALDKDVKEVEDSWREYREGSMRVYSDAIEGEKKEQWRAEGQSMLFDVKKENVALQLEAVYRERMLHTYNEVKRRLDYQVEIQESERRLQQGHMVNWVVDNVRKSITPQQEKEALQQCFSDLKALAAKA